jgi:hypothetical protein
MKIDLCIPVFDPENIQSKYLENLLIGASLQKMPFNRVILTSNHDLKNLSYLRKIFDGKLTIDHYKNNSDGISSNLNESIFHSEADIVKIMFQDDFFIDSQLNDRIEECFRDEKYVWQCSTSLNYSEQEKRFIKRIIPALNMQLIEGYNSVGSPSSISFMRTAWPGADCELSWMMDCDIYLKFWHGFGLPFIDSVPSIVSRIHKHQTTNWAINLAEKELLYFENKYRLSNFYN